MYIYIYNNSVQYTHHLFFVFVAEGTVVDCFTVHLYRIVVLFPSKKTTRTHKTTTHEKQWQVGLSITCVSEYFR